MATWKKVIVSGSQAELAAVSASAFRVSATQILGPANTTGGTIITGSFSGSFAGTLSSAISVIQATSASVVQITDTTSGVGPYYPTFVDATTGHPLQRTDSTGLRYNATSNELTSSVFVSDKTSGVGFVGTSSFALTSSVATTVSTTTDNTGTTYYIPFVASSTGVPNETLRVDSGISYVPSTDTVTLAGDIAINGGDITTNQATFNLLAGATTAINIGATSTTVAILGNLEVRGATTTVSSSNLLVSDKFAFLASGSTSAANQGGIIVSNAANSTGSAFFYDGTNTRWGLATAVGATDTSATAKDWVVSVSSSNAAPTNNPTYGGTTGLGNMYIDTSLTAATDNNIWIYA